MSEKHLERISFFGMMILLLAVYSNSVATRMTWAGLAGDSPDYIVSTVLFEKAFLAGYPFYIMIGWLFQQLSFGSVYNLGLLSAVSTLVTSGLIYLLIRKYTGLGIWPFVGALAYASSFIVFTQSVIPEVYTFSTMLMVLGVYLTLKRSSLMMIAFGLALATHPFVVFAWIPALVMYYKTSEHSWRIRQLLVSITISVVIAFAINFIFTFAGSSEVSGSGEAARLRLILVSFAYVGGLAVLPLQSTIDRFVEAGLMVFISLASLYALAILIKREDPNIQTEYFLCIVAVGPLLLYLTGFPPQWVTYLVPSMAFLIPAIVIRASNTNMTKVAITSCVMSLVALLVISSAYNVREDHGMETSWQRLNELPDNTVVIALIWGHASVLANNYNRINDNRLTVVDIVNLPWETEAFGDEELDVRKIEALYPGRNIVVATLEEHDGIRFKFVPSNVYHTGLNNTSYIHTDNGWQQRVRGVDVPSIDK